MARFCFKKRDYSSKPDLSAGTFKDKIVPASLRLSNQGPSQCKREQ